MITDGPPPMHAEDLRRYLAHATGRPVRLRVNSNTHSLVSARNDGAGPGIIVSLHRMFLDAEPAVFTALAKFVVRPTPAVRKVIRDYINASRHRIAEASQTRLPRVVRGTPHGNCFDLQLRAASLNQRYFNDLLRFRIIWGRNSPTPRRQRHVTLGTWNDRQRIIRIHPILDQPEVPPFFLDFVIYHEMVHIAVPSRCEQNGRLLHHSREFRALESTYDSIHEAREWEHKSLPRLIAAWSRRPAPRRKKNP